MPAGWAPILCRAAVRLAPGACGDRQQQRSARDAIQCALYTPIASLSNQRLGGSINRSISATHLHPCASVVVSIASERGTLRSGLLKTCVCKLTCEFVRATHMGPVQGLRAWIFLQQFSEYISDWYPAIKHSSSSSCKCKVSSACEGFESCEKWYACRGTIVLRPQLQGFVWRA